MMQKLQCVAISIILLFILSFYLIYSGVLNVKHAHGYIFYVNWNTLYVMAFFYVLYPCSVVAQRKRDTISAFNLGTSDIKNDASANTSFSKSPFRPFKQSYDVKFCLTSLSSSSSWPSCWSDQDWLWSWPRNQRAGWWTRNKNVLRQIFELILNKLC